jgi:hypothetical protein
MFKHLLLGALLGLLTLQARAEEPTRLALLIGNQGYTQKVGPLKNPHDDVALIDASLQRLGFKVTLIRDATYRTRIPP